MGIFDRHRGGSCKVHVLIKGRIGETWRDVDRYVRVPVGTTLGKLVEVADREGIPLREALVYSPQLVVTMMLNGERCPFAENRERVLADGDEIYLLAPLAGG
jgi:molybdopterin converting factor small subunit